MERFKSAFTELLGRLTCLWCGNLLALPVTLSCGHSVCGECAKEIMELHELRRSCGKCGKPARPVNYLINYTLHDAALTAEKLQDGLMETCKAKDSTVSSSCFMGTVAQSPLIAPDNEEWIKSWRTGASTEKDSAFGSACSLGSMDPPPEMAPVLNSVLRTSFSTKSLRNRLVRSEEMPLLPPHATTRPVSMYHFSSKAELPSDVSKCSKAPPLIHVPPPHTDTQVSISDCSLSLKRPTSASQEQANQVSELGDAPGRKKRTTYHSSSSSVRRHGVVLEDAAP